MSCQMCDVDFCDSEDIWLTTVLFSRDPMCVFSHWLYSPSATQHQWGFPCYLLQPWLGAHPLPFQLCQKSLLNWKSRPFELSFPFSDLPLLLWTFMSFLKAPFNFWAACEGFILSSNLYARLSCCLKKDLSQEGTTMPSLLSLRWGMSTSFEDSCCSYRITGPFMLKGSLSGLYSHLLHRSVELSLEKLQGWRFRHLSGQPVPVLHCSHGEIFSLCAVRTSRV